MNNKIETGAGRVDRVTAFSQTRGHQVEAFLDQAGYTGREVRSIAKHAIALWETRPSTLRETQTL